MDYHDLLARLGEGSAHPGGFSATIQLLNTLTLPARGYVLEVGCGTGRTACFLDRAGYRVTAVEPHRGMLEKAVRRARHERRNIRFVQASAEALPFPEGSFDVVFVESVTIFARRRRALAEYRRVLKPGGILIDRELTLSSKRSDRMMVELKQFFGIRTLATVTKWKAYFMEGGFGAVKVLERSSKMGRWGIDHDPLREMDSDLYADEQVKRMSRRNDRLLEKYGGCLGYAVFAASVTATDSNSRIE